MSSHASSHLRPPFFFVVSFSRCMAFKGRLYGVFFLGCLAVILLCSAPGKPFMKHIFLAF